MLKNIFKFISILIVGNNDYNHIKCENCESSDLKQVNESADGFYVEFECANCKKHTIY